MSILDIVECSANIKTGVSRVNTMLVRREMERTTKSIADTFAFTVTSCVGTMNTEQIERYQRIWEEYGDLMREIQVGN